MCNGKVGSAFAGNRGAVFGGSGGTTKVGIRKAISPFQPQIIGKPSLVNDTVATNGFPGLYCNTVSTIGYSQQDVANGVNARAEADCPYGYVGNRASLWASGINSEGKQIWSGQMRYCCNPGFTNYILASAMISW
jgi:hypothetical protein